MKNALVGIKVELEAAKNEEELFKAVNRLESYMKEMLSNPDYAPKAEVILKAVEQLRLHDIVRGDLFQVVDEFLASMGDDEEEENTPEEKEQSQLQADFESLKGDFRNVSKELLNTVRGEMAEMKADVTKAVKENPKTNKAVTAVKGTAKKFNNGLKKGIRNWLLKDEDSDDNNEGDKTN